MNQEIILACLNWAIICSPLAVIGLIEGFTHDSKSPLAKRVNGIIHNIGAVALGLYGLFGLFWCGSEIKIGSTPVMYIPVVNVLSVFLFAVVSFGLAILIVILFASIGKWVRKHSLHKEV